MKSIKPKNEKGASLLLTILIMSAILAIAMGISKLSLNEIKMSREYPESYVAYYAAETGMEQLLYLDHTGAISGPDLYNSGIVILGDGITYIVSASDVSPNRKLQSSGFYKDTNRAIELTY